MNYIFGGAGRIGKYAVDLWHTCNCNILYFIDSDSRIWGNIYKGIPIFPPIKICDELAEYQVILTCRETEALYNKLIEYGISEEKIVKWSEVWKVLPYIWGAKKVYKFAGTIYENRSSKRVLFDLQNGLVLGGVEAWTFQTAKSLRMWGIETRYLVDRRLKNYILQEKENAIELEFCMENGMSKNLNLIAEVVDEKVPCNVICNFVGDIFIGACYAKHMTPQSVQIITVIHNDEEIYYNAYIAMERYITYCFVISSKMKKILIERGFPKEKICFLDWELIPDTIVGRVYSGRRHPLSLGYAGRITIAQKRMDLLWEVIQRLIEKSVDFIFEVAGIGDYLEKFSALVEDAGLQDKILFLGMIPREEIPLFWQRQDIMVSCSDWEGHSITQAEAMAAGAVPVITDVSGARDDVDDGENGFVVNVGDIDGIVEKICFLYEHRELLSVMGRKAYETIKSKSEAVNLEKFWKSILI